VQIVHENSNDDVDDASLAAASQRGDRSAFESLVRRTARLLFARLYLDTSGDAHRAEDLVQETYLLAWRRVRELNDPKKFRPWLMQIGQSVLLDSVKRDARKKRSAPRGANEAVEEVRDPSTATPSESASRDEERQRAIAALQSLPEEYRLPLTLRYLADANYETIAKQLALSNGALRGLLQRGMKLMRERMREKNE
jgi:RNA polymerase sigma-70 factor (ECF subfamily)